VSSTRIDILMLQKYFLTYPMRTTVRLSDDLLRKARKKAAEEGRTLTSLIEEGLKTVLTESKPVRRMRVHLPISKASGGTLPGVDLNRSSDLQDLMETR
jgi:hypothetical protein